MKVLQPINQENQLFDVLEGKPASDMQAKEQKIATVKKNIENVISVNGKKVFDPIVDDEYISYNLQKAPEWIQLGDTRKYYYPIEYATIKIK